MGFYHPHDFDLLDEVPFEGIKSQKDTLYQFGEISG